MNAAHMGFTYRVREFDASGNLVGESKDTNLIPVEGLNYMIETALRNGTPIPALYVGLYSADYTPTPSDTAATFPALATEITAYASPTRPLVSLGAAVGGQTDNTASLNEFVGTTNGTVARGGFVSASPTKGGTLGPLLSAVRFSSPKQLEQGGRLEVTVVFSAVSV